MKFLKKRDKRSDCWKLTDNIIRLVDEVHDVRPEFSNKFEINKTYTCLRDMNGTNIYILEGALDKLKSIELIYDSNANLLNTTILENYEILRKVYPVVANKAVPPAVNIKFVKCCNIMDINIFMERIFILEQKDELFKDLLNFQTLKLKYNLDKV